MKNFKEMLKIKIEDETAAFTILGVMIVTFAILIGIFEGIRINRVAEVNSSIKTGQIDQAGEASDAGIYGEVNGIANEIVKDNEKEEKEKDKIDEEKLKEENQKEFEKLKKENKVSSAVDKYYIKVNYGAQVVNIYKKDGNGEYKPYKAMLCSTGTYTPTSGVYRTLAKGNWWPLYGDVFGQYSTHIYDGILFHSVPYLEAGNKSSLEYWAYDQLGQRVSMGCVRLTTIDAKWIYENCPVGTQVEFYSSSNPGPFGKPTARKISNAPEEVRGWDPTDPDKNNPWPKYLKELAEKENEKDEQVNEVTNEISQDLVNDVINDIVNDTSDNDAVNDMVNDISNNIVNDIANEIIDEPLNDVIINDTIDSTINEITNDTDSTIDETINDISNEIISEPVNEIITDTDERNVT